MDTVALVPESVGEEDCGYNGQMHYQSYSSEIDRYELEEGFSLQRATNQEFTKYWVVYRAINEDFAQSFAESRQELDSVPFCFWILLDNNRIGGAILLPNGMDDFFLIPPANDVESVLAVIMPLLEAWSDSGKPISAQAIPPQYLGAFQSAGFVLKESRHLMNTSPARLQVGWPSNWSLHTLAPTDADGIASLLEAAFSGGVGQFGERGYEAHLSSTEQYFEKYDEKSPCGQASAMVRDLATGTLVGICMVETHKGIPTIRFVAVLPDYQQLGIARNLMNRAIDSLEPGHDWVK